MPSNACFAACMCCGATRTTVPVSKAAISTSEPATPAATNANAMACRVASHAGGQGLGPVGPFYVEQEARRQAGCRGGPVRREPSQQPPAICDQMVWARCRPGWRFRGFRLEPATHRRGGVSAGCSNARREQVVEATVPQHLLGGRTRGVICPVHMRKLMQQRGDDVSGRERESGERHRDDAGGIRGEAAGMDDESHDCRAPWEYSAVACRDAGK